MAEAPEKMFALAVKLSDNMPDKPRALDGCGDLFMKRFHHTHDKSDIDNSIRAYELAIQHFQLRHQAIDDVELVGFIHDTGLAFLERYMLLGNLSDIDQAIAKFETVTNSTSDYVDMHDARNELGMAFRRRFDKTKELKDISAAISSIQRAIHLAPPDHANVPGLLNNLGNSFQARFELSGDLGDISGAISCQQKALLLTPESHQNMPILLNNLGNSFRVRFDRAGDLADISEAIISLQKAVGLPQSHPIMRHLLNSLGNSFFLRFNRTGDLADISEAILCQQKAIDLTPQDHIDMFDLLNDLGASFQARFELTGDLAEINEAISSEQKALQRIPPGHPDAHRLLTNLGNSFLSRFEHTGDLTDVSDAIISLQKAVHATPQDHVTMPVLLNNLGNSFSIRFLRTGDLPDIFEGIMYQQKAILLTPDDHPDKPGFLNNLGNSLQFRFQRNGDLSDILEAISSQQKALHLTPQGHAAIPGHFNNLGNSFLCRFKLTGDLTDISEAISSHKQAVHSTPHGNAAMPLRLNNLGLSFANRFERTKESADITEAIIVQLKAVSLVPEGHADGPRWLNNLGDSFQTRFESLGEIDDIHAAILRYSQAATYSTGRPATRLSAARKWAKLCQKFNRSQLLDAYRTAIHLLSQVAGLEQTIESRHTNLLDISNISCSAAASAFDLGNPELAVEWLEEGRCLVWSQLNSLRTPLDALRAHDPAVAEEILKVSRALENAGSRGELAISPLEATMEQKMTIQDEATSHIKLAKKWDKLLTDIRAIPDFEDFLRPPLFSNLIKHLPDSGAVVVINVHELRCDALALVSTTDKPLHIPLPDFSHEKADNLRKELREHLRSSGLRMREYNPDESDGRMPVRYKASGSRVGVIQAILQKLWSWVVKPIVEALGYLNPTTTSNTPRIWWCATGPLAFLPIHAAGKYTTEPIVHASSAEIQPDTLFDFAISSYTPTVRALVERVKKPREVNDKNAGLFMISQPNTPDLPYIPGTTKEVNAINLQLQNIKVTCLEGEAATVDQAIEKMGTHSSIHFACHASQNIKQPLKSGFYLHDGRLEISSIIKQNFIGADLAFLSACQTSTGEETLSEEAVHLAAGMLAAGYRGVIATMWSIKDLYGPQIAEDFYANLTSKSKSLSGDDAARALHFATQKLRKQIKPEDGDSSLLVWVPYVHFGL
ncbi:hypothetical protein GALMADRAFT_136203 [Galerina marginata CBS 339.88]|uniref:CHAT domain-containing protein n=1 Tax=Galerina marginata (strain CBS 339.88) TaxID=685588 RepID=A0A067TQA3_GALM3|nr:hypothetical protein GALMADRAFT_136203 [Galerina marginata CBS 339.88]